MENAENDHLMRASRQPAVTTYGGERSSINAGGASKSNRETTQSYDNLSQMMA